MKQSLDAKHGLHQKLCLNCWNSQASLYNLLSSYKMSAFKSVLKLFNPKFYADHFQVVVNNTRKDFIAGSPAPLFKAMVVVGVVGYIMEYSLVGSKFYWIYSYYRCCLFIAILCHSFVYLIVPSLLVTWVTHCCFFENSQSITLRIDRRSFRRLWPTTTTKFWHQLLVVYFYRLCHTMETVYCCSCGCALCVTFDIKQWANG